LGNVLLNFQPSQFLTRFINDQNQINDFIAKVIKNELWRKLDRGVISLDNARDEYIAKFPEDSESITSFFTHWKEMLTPINGNINILHELKANGYSLYALSNFINEAFEYVQNCYDFFTLFDGKVISSEIKFIKPELQIYQHLIKTYNLDPGECVYIEDVANFLIPASKLSMKVIHYSPQTDLRKELRKIGVKI
jgi:HAD superfamily hydrolase (TIGR01509 family)